MGTNLPADLQGNTELFRELCTVQDFELTMPLKAVELGMDLRRGDVLQGLASMQPALLSSLPC